MGIRQNYGDLLVDNIRLRAEAEEKGLYLQRLTGYGVNYRSFTEQYLDSTGVFKEAVIGILAAVAKQERVRLSERTIAGLQRARAQGRIGGRPRVDDDPGTIKAFRKLRQSGLSVRKIAAEMGVSPTTVQKMAKVGSPTLMNM